MTVNIREFVLRLGVDSEGSPGSKASGAEVTHEDLENMREELLRQMRGTVEDVRVQPFDR